MTVKWIAQGKRYRLSQLVKHGRIALELLTAHETELGRAGWSAQDTATFKERLGQLERAATQRIQARLASRQATQDEEHAVFMARQFVRQLRNVLPRVTGDAPEPTQVLDTASQRLGRTPDTVSQYIRELLPLIPPLDEPLSRYFAGKPVSAMLLELKGTVERADSTQALKRASSSLDTLALAEAKGQMVQYLTDLSHMADNAFVDRPALALQFRQPLRALRRRGARPTEEPETTPPTKPPLPTGPQPEPEETTSEG